MDCLQQLTHEGGSTSKILICRSQWLGNRLGLWIVAHPLWTVGLLVGTLVIVTLVCRMSRSVFARQKACYEAKKRAETLLRDSITHAQYKQLIDFGYLEIPSRLYPGYLYRIPRTQQRVQIYETNRVDGTNRAVDSPYARKLAELCVVASDQVPDADMVLAHKLMIEADEQTYLSIANRIG